MRYLIIGGKSVFVVPLVHLLLKKGDTENVTVSHLPHSDMAFRSGLEHIDCVDWIELDLRDDIQTSEAVLSSAADRIFDLASQDSVGYAWKNPNETVDINVIGTLNLLNAIKELKCRPRLVVGGSGEEYGHLGFDRLPIKESETPNPLNIFGASKAAQTMFCKLYGDAYDMDVIVLRTFNEISVLQDDKWAISSFCKQFVKIERGLQDPVIHVGNTNVIRDFTDVEDLVRAFDMVACEGHSGEVYNAARGIGISVGDILNTLQEITGIKARIVTDRSKVRPIDAPCIVADVKKIYEHTGWKAKIDIRDTLSQMIELWRGRL